MWPNAQFAADLVTNTEEILNEKLHFCAVIQATLECRFTRKLLRDIIITYSHMHRTDIHKTTQLFSQFG